MAEQFAIGNHSTHCPFCGSFIKSEEFTVCTNCQKGVRNYSIRKD